jgi:hypothetical protein
MRSSRRNARWRLLLLLLMCFVIAELRLLPLLLFLLLPLLLLLLLALRLLRLLLPLRWQLLSVRERCDSPLAPEVGQQHAQQREEQRAEHADQSRARKTVARSLSAARYRCAHPARPGTKSSSAQRGAQGTRE